MTDPFKLLRDARTIAVVGASPSPDRESHGVMRYLLNRATAASPCGRTATQVLGIPCVPTLLEIEEPIDLVDVFRRPEFCAGHAREAVAAGAKALWLQLGIVSPEARAIAEGAGLGYVENACTAVVHARGLRRVSLTGQYSGGMHGIRIAAAPRGDRGNHARATGCRRPSAGGTAPARKGSKAGSEASASGWSL